MGHTLTKEQQLKFNTPLAEVVASLPHNDARGTHNELLSLFEFHIYNLFADVPINTPFALIFNQAVAGSIAKEVKLLKGKKTFCDLTVVPFEDLVNEGVSKFNIPFYHFLFL